MHALINTALKFYKDLLIAEKLREVLFSIVLLESK